MLVLGGAVGYGSWRINQWHELSQPGPTVAVVQTAVVQDNQQGRTVEQILDHFRDLIELHGQAAQPRRSADSQTVKQGEPSAPGARSPT